METIAYSTIQPPVTLKFRTMSKKELRQYYKWFQEIMPQRVIELAKAVKASRDSEDWQLDWTPASLDALGSWFATQVQTRPRMRQECDEIAAQSPFPIERSDWEFTTRTLSLAMDVGMYLSQVFSRNHPSLTWDQPLGSKNFIDYGQPVLVGFAGKVPFNPIRMVTTLAYGIAKKSETGEGLRKVYDIWSKLSKDD